MKYAGMPMGMWALFAGSFRKDLTPAMCRLGYTMSDADGASDFVREYTLASGGPYCDCGYHKRNKQNKGSTAPA